MVWLTSVLALAGAAVVSASQTTPIQGVYMAELQPGATLTPTQLADELSAHNVTIQIRRSLNSKLFNGISFEVLGATSARRRSEVDGDADADADAVLLPDNALAIDAVLAIEAVKQVWPIRGVTAAPPNGTESFISVGDSNVGSNRRRATDDYYPHVMSQVDLLHKAGFTGKGIRIGVVDTGIDYTHPILGGCLGPDCIVTHGWDSVGHDDLIGNSIPEPDDDPMDCAGHGTHVAGIISALPNDFGFLGVAPDARLGAYRALDCFGYGTEETISAGMLRAFDDGSDIITLSVSVDGGLPDSLVSLTATRIVEAGVPVFVAIANTGEYGSMFDAVAPADARLVNSISSFDPVQEPNVYATAQYEVDGGEPEDFGWAPLLSGRYEFEGGADNATFPLIDLNGIVVNNTTVNGCQPDIIPDLTGYLVLVELTATSSSECVFRTRRQNIVAKGGTNLMFWGPETVIRSIINDDLKSFIATTTTSPATKWREALAAGSNITVTLTVPSKAVPQVIWTTNNATGGQVSSYSTWGPTFDLRSAPTFGGPGRAIMSTWINHGVFSVGGTSMAAPFVAGAAALLGQARGTFDPHTMQVLLASTAKQPRGLVAPMQAGAGLVQLWDAAQVKGVLSVSSISFNDSDHHLKEVAFTLHNTGDTDASYELGHITVDTIYSMTDDGRLARVPFETTDATAQITFAEKNVSVPAGGEVEITVLCTPPQGVQADRWPIYSGYISLNGTNGDALSIPYMGNAGSMHNGTVIREDEIFISPRFVAEDVVTLPRPGDAPAPPSWDDLAITVFTLLPTHTLRYDIIVPPPVSGNSTSIHSISPSDEWLGRKTYGPIWGTPVSVFARAKGSSVTFAGFLANGTALPEGRYALLISALRLFAPTDSVDENDWQTMESAPFNLRYQV